MLFVCNVYQQKFCMNFSSFHECHILHSFLPVFDHPVNICRAITFKKLINIKFYTSSYLLLAGAKKLYFDVVTLSLI